MCAKCDKKCCANSAHCYQMREGGSYGCTQNVFKPGDLLEDEIHGEFQDGDTTCQCWDPEEEEASTAAPAAECSPVDSANAALLEKMLTDISNTSAAAMTDAAGLPDGERIDIYNRAMNKIGEFFKESELDAAPKKDRQLTAVKLPNLFAAKELGSPCKDGTRRVYGLSCASVNGVGTVQLYVDGKRVGYATLDVGHFTAIAIAKAMKYALISRKEKAIRHRLNKLARQKGGAE